MSRSVNQVVLLGNLTRDPELRAIASGSSVCRFGLALNSDYTDSGGERIEKTTFVDIVTWNKTAEIVSQYCQKGKQVCVVGRLESSSWEQDGQKRSKLEVTASQVIFTQGQGSAGTGRAESPEPDETKPETDQPAGAKKPAPVEEKINIDDVPF